MKIRQFAIHIGPVVCAAVLSTAGVHAAEPAASNAVQTQPHHRVTAPPKPVVATEIMPGIPDPERLTIERGKGRVRGFDTRRHRLPSGEYIRD